MKRFLLLLLALALFVGALVLGWNFGAANETTVEIDLLWIRLAEITVWQLALAAFLLGAGLVLIFASFMGARGWLLKRRYRKTIRRLESELHQMRSLPLAGADDEATGADPALVAGGRA